MEKYLRVEFFKRLHFPTKADGMEFIKKNQKLKKTMVKMGAEIEAFHNEKIEEFENEIDRYETEKKEFLKEVKLRRKEQVQEKKENEKMHEKENMRLEILKEIELEREKELISKHKDLYPKECYVNVEEIMKTFANLIKNKSEMSKTDIDELKTLKRQFEKAHSLMSDVNSGLMKLNKKLQ
jgi:hypothetical protein